MKGDFSRISYDPKKRYTRVLKQQGRVDLDSDWNEQSSILDILDRKKATDVIGHCGVPKKGGGFQIFVRSFLNDIAFSSDTNAWAVGNDANILFSEDGGETWESAEVPFGISVNFWGVSFPTEENGWVVGEEATILHIQPDQPIGGITIEKQTPPIDIHENLNSVFFINGDVDHGWVAGNHGLILSTENGGESWTRQAAPESVKAHIRNVFFVSVSKGWAVGDDATILSTSNGGEIWVQQTLPASITESISSVHFTSENDGWVVGDNGLVLLTTDGVQNWFKKTLSGFDKHLKDVYFESKEQGFIVGEDGLILRTLNEGADWSNQQSNLNTDLFAIDFSGGGLGCIVGQGGSILTQQANAIVWNKQTLPSDFRVSLIASDGRIYVDGLCCEQEKNTSYFNQVDFPNPPEVDKVDGQTDLIYLDVWERHITAIEDPDVREVALGGPDTTTRVKTTYQIKVESDVNEKNCKKKIEGWPPESGKGRLTTRTVEDATSDQPCIIAPGGGYRGLENQLYRVEIHTAGDLNTATFKWSRDNGSVVYAIENFEEGSPNQIKVKQLGKDYILKLKIGDWVEILGDETELKGVPGTLAQIDDIKEAQKIIILNTDVSAHNHESHPKIRRWDQESDAILVTPDTLVIEKGIEIQFSGSNFKTGDYWVFAARTATANVEELTDEPPMGIKHHYCKLALVTWQAQNHGKWKAKVRDCRKDFPSLTEICAEDICFDNSGCEFAEAETVQDAIDRLCQSNNLRFHNKHLHGWGIVCGLQVYCGTDIEQGRNTVKVKEGYALDCDGNDLVIKNDETIQLMEMIIEKGLLDGQDGEVCLTLGLDENNQLKFDVELYDPNDTSNTWKGGALVQNIYNNCLKPVIEFFTEEITGNGDEKALVGIHQKRITVLLNLLIQFLNPEFGKRVYLSPQEDEILRELYEALKELLRSKTYCAMFDNVQQFPEYPGELAELNIPTIFGKGFTHTRVRVDHQSNRAYTVGGLESPAGSNKIHVYDLGSQNMVAELEFPGGLGIKVQDVAFSAEGNELYAIGLLNDEDTIFAVADIIDGEELSYQWRPIATYCDIQMATLATSQNTSGNVYALGRGLGLFVVEPNQMDPVLQAAVSFDATGHLIIDPETNRAYATVSNDLSDPLQYNQVIGIDLNDLSLPFQTFNMGDPATGALITGEDDIAITAGQDLKRLCVVANALPNSNSNNKQLFIYNITENSGNQFQDHIVDLEENTDIQLAYNPVTNYLMVTYEDSYRVRLVNLFNADIPLLEESYHHPVQIFPQSIAVGRSSDDPRVYVHNWISNTINVIPSNRFHPEAVFPLEPLTAYRNDVLEAFVDLFGKFMQYLKDCICDQFLLNCPGCDEEDKIYLACVSIRENQVYKVCNFSKRKYVKSFPAFDYWLSFIPIAPLLRKVFETACCTVLPDLFANFSTGERTSSGFGVRGTQVKYGYASLQNLNFSSMFSERKSQVNSLQTMAKDWIGNFNKKQVVKPERKVKRDAVVGKPLDEVTKTLAKSHINVERIESYNPETGPKNLMKFTVAPTRLKAHSRVVLYEEKGKVKYYALAEKGPENVKELRNRIDEQETNIKEIKGLQSEVNKLRKQLKEVQDENLKAVGSRDKEIAELKATVDQFSKFSTDFESLRKEVVKLSKGRG
ncbi:MAG: DUF6519 domain-containing protein [Bacteroidales bacterium]